MSGDGEILAALHLDIDALQRADDAVAHAIGLGEIARHDLGGRWTSKPKNRNFSLMTGSLRLWLWTSSSNKLSLTHG